MARMRTRQVSYQYGAPVWQAGKPLAPPWTPSGGWIGVVLTNVLEVHGTSSGGPPLRLLRSGDLFGTFEALDAILQTGSPTVAPDSFGVTAGTRSVQVVFPLGNDALKGRLRKKLALKTDNAIPAILDDGCKLVALVRQHLESPPWSADVLYVPLPPGGVSAGALVTLLRSAWPQVTDSKCRQLRRQTIAAHLAKENLPKSYGSNVPAIADFVTYIESVAETKEPVFVSQLAHSDDTHGPFSSFASTFTREICGLSSVDKSDHAFAVMYPKYLGENIRAGLVPIDIACKGRDRIVMEFASADGMDKLHNFVHSNVEFLKRLVPSVKWNQMRMVSRAADKPADRLTEPTLSQLDLIRGRCEGRVHVRHRFLKHVLQVEAE